MQILPDYLDPEPPDEDEPAPKSIQEITGIDFRNVVDREKQVADRFAVDIAEHVTKVVRDDGIYRYLTIRKPGSSTYWCEVLTWPGVLVIRGDMGTYAFSRLTDMFEFFRSKPGYINTTYWAEKLIAHDGVKSFSGDSFRQSVAERLAEWIDDLTGFTGAEEKIAGLIAAVKARVIRGSHDDESARHALGEFWHEEHQFSDVWEMDFTEYTTQFLWCLHAIVHAINEYDRLDEESDDPLLLVGLRRGEGDTLDVSIDGFSVGGVGGDSAPVAKFRVAVERVTDDA